jgi:hypothetical protein
MSILAQLHTLAPPGMQKRVVACIGAFVFLFMLFTVFVSIRPTSLKQPPFTHYIGCNLPMHSNACCLEPRNFPQSTSLPFCHVCRTAKRLQGCWNMMSVNFFTSSMNLFLDVLIFILPLHGLFKLHISHQKKSTSNSFSQHRIVVEGSQ